MSPAFWSLLEPRLLPFKSQRIRGVMKASAISSALKTLIVAQQPTFIWGPPGIGKSSLVRQLAHELGLALQDIRALLLDPVDIRGLPYLGPDGRSKWAAPDFLPSDGAGILFLDELNAAPGMVQAAFYQLVLDRKLGEYTLPDDWVVVAAGNRETDRAQTSRMPTPLRNRFVHLEFEVDMEVWSEWAIHADIRPEVIAFIRFRPQLLSLYDKDAHAFASPRSWEFVSKILKSAPDPYIEHELFSGAVGNPAATEFSGFLRMFRELPNIDAILLNPTSEPVPDAAAAQYAVASALAHRATDTNFDRICLYLDRMPTEFRVLCVRDATLREPSIKYTAGYTKWAIQNHHVLA
jgi:MoxR-like ATPase